MLKGLMLAMVHAWFVVVENSSGRHDVIRYRSTQFYSSVDRNFPFHRPNTPYMVDLLT